MNTQSSTPVVSTVNHTELVNSWFDLGMRYLNSNEPNSFKHASRWLLKAALNGHIEAAFKLGALNECRGKSHLKQAFHWYRQAALRGHIEAMTSLARAYNYGYGTEISFEKARYWQQRSETMLDVFDAFHKIA